METVCGLLRRSSPSRRTAVPPQERLVFNVAAPLTRPSGAIFLKKKQSTSSAPLAVLSIQSFTAHVEPCDWSSLYISRRRLAGRSPHHRSVLVCNLRRTSGARQQAQSTTQHELWDATLQPKIALAALLVLGSLRLRVTRTASRMLRPGSLCSSSPFFPLASALLTLSGCTPAGILIVIFTFWSSL